MDVYGGAEGKLWELIMGEQIHAGGMASSMALAASAGIAAGMRGIDLCCCFGAGMRFLVRHLNVEMCGVDATQAVLEDAERRARDEGLADRCRFALSDVLDSPYEDSTFDFVWGEDAWCYVVDKDRLIAEAARLLKPGGTIAFTDWIEGPRGLSDEETVRINTFMKFPYMESIEGYSRLLERHGFEVKEAVQIEFGKYVDMYIAMLTDQLTYDALRILNHDKALLDALGAEMSYMRDRIHEDKMIRGRFVGIAKTAG
ncbi:MAG: methyltransferase domain-containing protein [bacterium]